MKRRQMLLSAASMLSASATYAQTPRLRRVAIAIPFAAGVSTEGITAFIKRMAELGWVDGRDLQYVYAYANGDGSRYEAVITELLAQKPDVLYAYFQPMALIAQKLTKEVPIVFSIVSNPELIGLVASLARPGANVTGLSTRYAELDGKRIELLREIVPGVQRAAVLGSTSTPVANKLYVEGYEKIAGKLGMQMQMEEAGSAEEIGPAFDRMVKAKAQGLLGTAGNVAQSRVAIVTQAARVRIPAVYVDARFVEAGGLVSYGTDNVDLVGRGAVYVDKILRGAKPADLPLEEPTNYRMALNLKTAKALNIKVSQSMLIRADQVID